MLYQLRPLLFSEYAVVDMDKFNKKYYEYFVQNIGDGKFLNYVTIAFKAQEGYNERNIIKEDFLDCTTPMPIFSENFVDKLKNDLANEMDFTRCIVKCCEKTFEYYIGKIIKTKEFVDKENSEYRISGVDGSKFMKNIKYFTTVEENDFLIARDLTYKYIFLVNSKFKEIIEKNNINIKLKEIK